MKPMKIGVVLLALVLAAMAIVPVVSAATNEKAVSPAIARHVAETQMKIIANESKIYADWEHGSLQPSTVYYDLMDQKTAYLFNVYADGEYSGYILASATRDNYPVLEYSRGKVPDAVPERLSRSQNAVQSSIDTRTQKTGSPTLLYLGGTFFYAQYPVLDSSGNTVDTKIVDISDNSVINLTEQERMNPIDSKEQIERETKRAKDANRIWNSFDTADNSTIISAKVLLAATGSKSIPGVPLFSQPQNNYCAPTSAAMVLSYWDSHGYPNIPDSSTTLINELATAMGTSTSTGTFIYNVNDGMDTVSSNHGYGSRLSFDEDSWVTFSDVTTEIGANKPFVLNMLGGGTAYGRSQAYGDHSVAVIGYESYSSGNYVDVQDTWTPLTVVSLAFGSWTGAVADYSRPT